METTADKKGESDGRLAYYTKRDDIRGDFIRRVELPESTWRAYEKAWLAGFRASQRVYR